jgi:hypothetical protein
VTFFLSRFIFTVLEHFSSHFYLPRTTLFYRGVLFRVHVGIEPQDAGNICM